MPPVWVRYIMHSVRAKYKHTRSVGSVHLILSALPAKVLNAIYAFGWKPDKQLGFLLLNQCVESKGVRSSMAIVM